MKEETQLCKTRHGGYGSEGRGRGLVLACALLRLSEEGPVLPTDPGGIAESREDETSSARDIATRLANGNLARVGAVR